MSTDTLISTIKSLSDHEAAKEAAKALDERFPGIFRMLSATAQEAEKKNGFNIQKVDAFLKAVGDLPPMLVRDHIPEKSLILLTAKPKHCKSHMALDIAHAIASGSHVFGEFEVNEPGPVVYLAMEDGEYEVKNRILQRDIHKEPALELYISTENYRIADDKSVALLEAEILQILGKAPRLLIIDTAAEALGVQKWEDRAELIAKMRPLRDLARRFCSILLVAHNRKAEGKNGDEIAGSNALTGSVDGWFSIQKKEVAENGDVVLEVSREGRGGIKGEISVRMDTHTLRFTALSPEDTAQLKEDSRREEEHASRKAKYKSICQLLAAGEKTQGEIGRDLEYTQPIVSACLRDMCEEGLCEKSGTRSTGGRATSLYKITTAGKKLVTPVDPVSQFFDEGEELWGEDAA